MRAILLTLTTICCTSCTSLTVFLSHPGQLRARAPAVERRVCTRPRTHGDSGQSWQERDSSQQRVAAALPRAQVVRLQVRRSPHPFHLLLSSPAWYMAADARCRMAFDVATHTDQLGLKGAPKCQQSATRFRFFTCIALFILPHAELQASPSRVSSRRWRTSQRRQRPSTTPSPCSTLKPKEAPTLSPRTSCPSLSVFL